MKARKLIVPLLVVALLAFVACDEDDEGDIVLNATLDSPNVAPSIALTGPDMPGNMFSSLGSSLKLWAVVADGNGLDDISGVFMTIGSVQINGVIARPDVSTSPPNFCDHGPDFTDNNDIDISSALPASAPGFTNVRLYRSSGGVYETPWMRPWDTDYGDGISLLDLEGASANFTPTDLTCVEFFDGYYVFMVNPPTVPASENVFVTWVDMTLRDISITVYDAAGETGTATIPDLRTVWSREEEEATLP